MIPRRPCLAPLSLGVLFLWTLVPGAEERPTARDLDLGLREIAAVYRLDPALVKAVISVESNFNPGAVSPKGARGLMQLMPTTASALGVERIHDPWENIEAGARYLRDRIDRFGGDLTLALAAYNAGEAAVLRHGGTPPYPETHRFVASVLARYRAFRSEPPARGTAPVAPAAAGEAEFRALAGADAGRMTPAERDLVRAGAGAAGEAKSQAAGAHDAGVKTDEHRRTVEPARPPIVIRVEEPAVLAEALAVLEEAIRLDAEGRLGPAAEGYRRALALDGRLDEARNRLGLLAMRAGRFDDARREFEAALRLNHDNARLLNNLGLAHYLEGDFRAALALFRKAWDQEPARVESGVNLALAQAQLGRRSAARASLSRVLRLDDRVPEAHVNLGSLLEVEGDRAGAVRHYRRFVELTAHRPSALREAVAERAAALATP